MMIKGVIVGIFGCWYESSAVNANLEFRGSANKKSTKRG